MRNLIAAALIALSLAAAGCSINPGTLNTCKTCKVKAPEGHAEANHPVAGDETAHRH